MKSPVEVTNIYVAKKNTEIIERDACKKGRNLFLC